MVILDADHPDIEEFIWCKASEERKARALRDAGFDMDLDGARLVQHPVPERQQLGARHRRVHAGRRRRRRLEPQRRHRRPSHRRRCKARELWREIATAAWECADPGLQFDTTINRWHTAHATGRINGSNPCSEYMHLDNSACNLASINLLKFLDDDGDFDVEAYKHTIEVVFTAQEILVGRADYPTETIGETTRAFRQLGLGYANLGALLMALGLPYDSTEGRAWAAALTSLMTGHAYATSATHRQPGWARSPGSPRTSATCSTCCGMHRDAPTSHRRRRRRARRRCARAGHRGVGARPCATARSTACATARPPCSRPPARSA